MMKRDQKIKEKMQTHFIYLVFLYTNVVVTFAFLYVLLDVLHLGKIVDHYSTMEHQSHWLDKITTAFYLSIITLFSVGYGDVTPFGLSRAVAIVEAMLGYILPAVIVIQFIYTTEKDR